MARKKKIGLGRRVAGWFGVLLLAVFTFVLLVQCWYFAHVLWWTRNNPESTRFMRDQLAVAMREEGRAFAQGQPPSS